MKMNKRLLSLLLALAMVFSMIPLSIAAEETETEAPETAEEYVLYEDTFDTDENLGDWSKDRAALSVADGKLVYDSKSSDAGRVFYKPGYNWTEYELSMTVDATPDWTDIYFLADEAYTNYYYLRLFNYNRTTKNSAGETVPAITVILYSVVNGVQDDLASTSSTYGTQMVDVKITIQDGTAAIYLLGSETAWHTVTLAEGAKGTIGLRRNRAAGTGGVGLSTTFESIKVTDLRDRANVTFVVDGKETVESVAIGDVPAYTGETSFDATAMPAPSPAGTPSLLKLPALLPILLLLRSSPYFCSIPSTPLTV